VNDIDRKRWLPQHGYPQATQYYLKYYDEILNDATMTMTTTTNPKDPNDNTNTNNKTIVSKDHE
jgi:hypothetical protein